MTPSPQTARYELLCTELEKLITDPRTSKRLRLTAITRLDDLLKRAERKEAAEGRRQEREARKTSQAAEEALQEQRTTEKTRAARDADAQMAKMNEHLHKLSQQKKS